MLYLPNCQELVMAARFVQHSPPQKEGATAQWEALGLVQQADEVLWLRGGKLPRSESFVKKRLSFVNLLVVDTSLWEGPFTFLHPRSLLQDGDPGRRQQW